MLLGERIILALALHDELADVLQVQLFQLLALLIEEGLPLLESLLEAERQLSRGAGELWRKRGHHGVVEMIVGRGLRLRWRGVVERRSQSGACRSTG